MSSESEIKDCKFEGESDGYDGGVVKHIPDCDWTFHCRKCGSHRLSWLMWVNDKNEVTGEGPDPSEAYCDACDAHGSIADDSL